MSVTVTFRLSPGLPRNELRQRVSLFSLILHHLYACLYQLFHQCRWDRFIYWKADNRLRCGITCKFLLVLLYHRRAHMQAYVGLLKTEPGKHPIIIKSWIRIPGHLEIVGALSGAGCGHLYGGSDLREVGSRLFGTACYVFVRSVCVF